MPFQPFALPVSEQAEIVQPLQGSLCVCDAQLHASLNDQLLGDGKIKQAQHPQALPFGIGQGSMVGFQRDPLQVFVNLPTSVSRSSKLPRMISL